MVEQKHDKKCQKQLVRNHFNTKSVTNPLQNSKNQDLFYFLTFILCFDNLDNNADLLRSHGEGHFWERAVADHGAKQLVRFHAVKQENDTPLAVTHNKTAVPPEKTVKTRKNGMYWG